MLKENVLTNIIQKINVDEDIRASASKQLANHKRIHSMIAYAKFKQDKLIGWEVHYNISQSQKYNTLTTADVINKLSVDLRSNCKSEKAVQSHLQPEPAILIKQYKWLIIKLAKEMHDHWEFLEMEDLVQMCNLVICDLYYKDYYVHKRLIRRSFTNYVLMHIRKNKNRPSMCSLEQLYHKSDADSDVTVAEMIPDKNLMYAEEDGENEEVLAQIIQEMREIVVDFIGQRQYDQLLREYGNKQTTPWSRKLMGKIKAHFFDMGITIKSFNKYYG